MSRRTPVIDPLPAVDATRVRIELCRWYVAERRELPWRNDPRPYPVWISEAMLQQTRVETVVSYFLRFLERLPDVRALAAAPIEEVLALWSGLGYYRRARALHAAAGVIVEERGGAFPEDRDGWLALPGVGPYTAGAVLSIAMQRREALVDGNVARVFCRLFGLDLDPRTGSGMRELWRIAEHLVPESPGAGGAAACISPGNWNQGLMELGALVCTPRSPDCGVCPLGESCRARREGRVEELPRRPPRDRPVEVKLEVLIATSERGYLLVKRPDEGRMAGLWELPTRELADDEGARHLWPAAHAGALSSNPRVGRCLGAVRHSITRYRIQAAVHEANLAPTGARDASPDVTWASDDDLARLPLTGMTRKILGRFGS